MRIVLVLAALACCVGQIAHARTALVIGNSAYPKAPLVNPLHRVDRERPVRQH